MPKNPSPEPASILDTVNMLDTMATDSSDSDSEVEPPLPIRLYSAKPRSLVQRRATITGASPTTKHGIDIEQFWKELKLEHRTTFQLRDKAASCAHGLDNVPSNIRPQTCLGIEPAKRRKKTDGQADDGKVQFQEKPTDTESAHSDDAKRMIYQAKERVIPTENRDGDISVASKDNNRGHSRVTDNVNDSNNSSDTSVPLDECNNFINDTHSVSKNASGDKEPGVWYVKERGKLDKSHSTPAYDLSDNEDKEDRKLALFEGSFCKIDLPLHYLNNAPDSNSTKTDVCMFIENIDDHKRLKDSSKEHKESSVKRCGGNVARKVSDIEKQIAQKEAAEQACVFGVPKELDSCKNLVRSMIDDVTTRNTVEKENQSDIECNISDISTCDKRYTADDSNIERIDCRRETLETICSKSLPYDDREDIDCDHSEMLNSEGACSSSSIDGDATLQKFNQILQTMIDGASTQHVKLIEKSSIKPKELSKVHSIEIKVPPLAANNSVEDNLSNITHNVSKIQISAQPQIKEVKCTAQATVQSCRYIELPKIESVKKLENKSLVTPPEPPPRKYYPKQAMSDLKLNSSPTIPENSEKPKVPERPNIKREFKRTDLNLPGNHVRSSSDCQDRKDSSDVCTLNYTDNLMDFIDESRVTSLNDQRFTQSDVSLYNENEKQLREEKYAYEKYEPFVEKFSYSSQSDCYKFDHSPRNVDSLDNTMHLKQMTPIDLKPKLSEKDKSFEKSVVNRAMMVARSFGLHGSLNKSNSSPRSSRKRNMLLASKYY